MIVRLASLLLLTGAVLGCSKPKPTESYPLPTGPQLPKNMPALPSMEQVRKTEGSVAQIEGLFERYRQEVAQSLDGYRRDIAVLRKEIAGALVREELRGRLELLGKAVARFPAAS